MKQLILFCHPDCESAAKEVARVLSTEGIFANVYVNRWHLPASLSFVPRRTKPGSMPSPLYLSLKGVETIEDWERARAKIVDNIKADLV